MTHRVRGLVLRTIPYGETSVVATVLTDLFGIQSYLVNGIRTASARKNEKAIMLRPAHLLDLDVYHRDQKNLNRIREVHWGKLHHGILGDVLKHSIALFWMEVLSQTIREPEPNPDLFDFCEDCLNTLDEAESSVMANLSLYFLLQLPRFFGFQLEQPDPSLEQELCILDLQEGVFTREMPAHGQYIEGKLVQLTAELLKVMQPIELQEIEMNRDTRKMLLQAYLRFYVLHLPEFGKIRSLAVLQEVLG
jgi:DNA repair protein RecO (recombination protein O)